MVKTMTLPQNNTSAAEIDGRRLRSRVSRAKIVEALMTLVEAGQVDPSAEEVTATAGVGLRSVFRHFKDMESLRQEISVKIEQVLRASLVSPVEGETWQARIAFIAARRAANFEAILPYHRAALVHSHRSLVLRADVERFNAGCRTILEAVAPPQLVADKVRFAAVELLLSFEAWMRLRVEQGLTPEEAKEAVSLSLNSLFKG